MYLGRVLYAHNGMYGPCFGASSVSSQFMHVQSDRALLMHTNPQESHSLG